MQVGVAYFVSIFAKFFYFDPAFFHQGLKAEFDGAGIDTRFSSKERRGMLGFS